MQLYKSFAGLPRRYGYIITIGNFDGIHLGHQQLLRELVQQARRHKVKSLLISFRNSDFQSGRLLLPREEQEKLLAQLGLDYQVRLDFRLLREKGYGEFIAYLHQRINFAGLVASDKLRIGKDRQGTPARITRECLKQDPGAVIKFIPSLKISRKTVSSTLLRSLLDRGRVDLVPAFLGRPYFLAGKIIRGKQLGSKIGYPTVNLSPPSSQRLPKFGVYVGRAQLAKKSYLAVVFIGIPLAKGLPDQNRAQKGLKSDKVGIEAHLLNFQKSVYNINIKIHLLDFIRANKIITSLEELKRLIACDLEAAWRYFGDSKKRWK